MSKGSMHSLGNYQLNPRRFPEGQLWARSMLDTGQTSRLPAALLYLLVEKELGDATKLKGTK